MIDGTLPMTKSPGGGSGTSMGESSSSAPIMKFVSRPRLLVLPDGAECNECVEWREAERSVIGWLPNPLLGLAGPKSPEYRELCAQLDPCIALTSNLTLLARDAPRRTGSSSASRWRLPKRL